MLDVIRCGWPDPDPDPDTPLEEKKKSERQQKKRMLSNVHPTRPERTSPTYQDLKLGDFVLCPRTRLESAQLPNRMPVDGLSGCGGGKVK